MYCPWCGSQLWTAENGEARCPSGAAFSVAATRGLEDLVPAETKPEKAPELTNWFCPTHGGRMVSTEEGPTCAECGRCLEKALLHSLIELNPHEAWPPKTPASGPLFAYWITRAGIGHPIGVTAHSLGDALMVAQHAGYEVSASCTIIENVRPMDLDPRHILPNSGPLVVRGVWYPLTRIGEGT